jgi:hypothetical protein
MVNLVRVVRRHVQAQEVGKFELPPDHLFAMEVPEGGSSCAKCKFGSEDGKHCGNQYFQDWRKSLKAEDPSELPLPADRYCCDVFAAE